MFYLLFKHLEFLSNNSLNGVLSTLFSVFGYPDETLSLVCDILHENGLPKWSSNVLMEYFFEGNPLPLLAKILIPVAGVLLIVLVAFTWYCCVRKKENGDMNDLMIESTLMVNNCF